VLVTTLILSHKAPEVAFAPETKEYYIIRNGYEILHAWDHLPVINRGLIRTRSMMMGAGIPVGDEDTFAG